MGKYLPLNTHFPMEKFLSHENVYYKIIIFLGECPEEACAIEVDCQYQNLRSRACFILIKGQKAIIWSGQGMPAHKKAVVESLEKSWPQLNGVTDLSREIEGQESEAFKVNKKLIHDYYCFEFGWMH